MKKWYKSKMLWTNIIGIAVIILQLEYGFVVSPEMQLAVLSVINLILRFGTNEGLQT